jgi:NAD(P)-dependent dehydrogenase (short-subunit alcohol dehydrogenase family)
MNTDPAGRRVALVTGASSGIGRAVALALGGDGFAVVVHGRDQQRRAEVVEEIEARGGCARPIGGDLSDPAIPARIAAEVGPVDVLVNNAGLSVWGPTAQMSAETVDALFAANVRGPFLLVGALAPGMVERGSGVIINVASMAGEIGLRNGAAYGATKAALASMTRAWAVEYAEAGVRVNAVSPGPVSTDPSKEERISALGRTTLLGRAADPEEIAGLVSYLASERASYITGATLAVDGGRTAA